MIQLVNQSASVLIAGAVLYACFTLTQSRKRLPQALPPQEGMLFVFMVPCLNEEEVIGRTVQRLMSLPGPEKAILVIDDGSEDGTAAAVLAAGADKGLLSYLLCALISTPALPGFSVIRCNG